MPPVAPQEEKGPSAFAKAATSVGQTAFAGAFPTLSKLITDANAKQKTNSNSDEKSGGGLSRGIGEVKYSVNRVAEQVATSNMILNSISSHQMTTNMLLGEILKKSGSGGGGGILGGAFNAAAAAAAGAGAGVAAGAALSGGAAAAGAGVAAGATSKWSKFLSYMEKKAPWLYQKVGFRLASAGAGLALPGPGWIWTALNVLGSLSLAWDVYELWKEFSGTPQTAAAPPKATPGSSSSGSVSSTASDAVKEAQSRVPGQISAGGLTPSIGVSGAAPGAPSGGLGGGFGGGGVAAGAGPSFDAMGNVTVPGAGPAAAGTGAQAGAGDMSDAVKLAATMVGKSRLESKEYLAAGGYNNQGEAWCAEFVNSTLKQSGYKGSGSAIANSFQNWGVAVDPKEAKAGDVVLQTRGKGPGQTGGHVGIATGVVTGSKIEMIAGNSGGKVKKYSVDINAQLVVRRSTEAKAGEKDQKVAGDSGTAPTISSSGAALTPRTMGGAVGGGPEASGGGGGAAGGGGSVAGGAAPSGTPQYDAMGNVTGGGGSKETAPAPGAATGTPPAGAERVGAKPGGKATESQKEYHDKMYNSLLEAAKAKGLQNPEVVAKLGAAQTSLETGYGKHMVGNNAFGIKGSGPNSVSAGTQEFVNGRMVGMKQNFRKYDDVTQSAGDYIDMMMKNPKRYGGVLGAKSVEEAIAAQAKSGYATDPNYGSKLASISGKMGAPASAPAAAPAGAPAAQQVAAAAPAGGEQGIWGKITSALGMTSAAAAAGPEMPESAKQDAMKMGRGAGDHTAPAQAYAKTEPNTKVDAEYDAMGNVTVPGFSATGGGRGSVVESAGERAAAQEVGGGRGSGAAELAQRKKDSAPKAAPKAAAKVEVDPHSKSKAMFQAVTDMEARGENSTAAFFAADKQRQSELAGLKKDEGKKADAKKTAPKKEMSAMDKMKMGRGAGDHKAPGGSGEGDESAGYGGKSGDILQGALDQDAALNAGAEPGYSGKGGQVLQTNLNDAAAVEAEQQKERAAAAQKMQAVDDADMARAPGEKAKMAQDAEVVAKADAGQSLAQQKASGSRAGGTMRNAIMGAFGSQGLPVAAPEPAAPAVGATLDQASRSDTVDERSSRQAISQNQSTDQSGGGSSSKGKEDIQSDKPGAVEPPGSRERFKELYDTYFAG
jgi:uncharacterized protein (TIGR02594 family)